MADTPTVPQPPDPPVQIGRRERHSSDLVSALRYTVLWVVPISALVLAAVGPEHTTVVVGVVVATFLLLVVLVNRRWLERALRAVGRPWSEPPVLRSGQEELASRLTALREAVESADVRLAAHLDGVISDVTESLKATADLAVYTARWSLGARALFFDRMARPVYVIHSHRPEEPTHAVVERDRTPRYTMPPVPVDEADFIPMVSQWALNSRTWVSSAESIPRTDAIVVRCACGVADDDPLLTRDIIAIGSHIFNAATRRLQEKALERDWLAFRFDLEESRSGDGSSPVQTVFVRGVPGGPYGGRTFRPDPEDTPPESGDLSTDYALLTRMPNPMGTSDSGRTFVVIAGGCLLAGQVALTSWLGAPANLHRLSIDYEDRACQYVLKVRYRYTTPWNPQVDEGSVEIVASAPLAVPIDPLS